MEGMEDNIIVRDKETLTCPLCKSTMIFLQNKEEKELVAGP